MPITLKAPGVYIEEIPSGVHTITGVATSIAAFVGWAPKGPTKRAQLVLSWADFNRMFGGLDARSLLGYAVYQFFNNGGQQAYIIRVIAGDAKAATLTLDGKLTLTATSEGVWANQYGIAITNRVDTSNTIDQNRFRLAVITPNPAPAPETVVEVFENLAMNPNDPRYVVEVLGAQSQYVTAAVVGGATTPPANTATPSPLLGNNTKGVDGAVLSPNDGAFETLVLPVNPTSGAYYLDRIDLFNLLCVPGESNPAFLSNLEAFCVARRAFLIADTAQGAQFSDVQNGPDSALVGADGARNAALYFPWINAPDPLSQNRPSSFPPSGFVAGMYALTDANRGVWKAPAGTGAGLTGVMGVTVTLTNQENGVLNPQAINCIRTFSSYGTLLWGARTLKGSDAIGSEWKYVPVRRTALFIEESLYRGTQWVVFEPNDEPLWAQIRLNVGAFMHNLFRQGAFEGTTPQDAYFVKCDKETTTQNDIDLGVVNVIVGFAPLKPAEFVVIQIQQIAGQIQV